MWMVGVKFVFDVFGWVNKIELVFLEELGCFCIDVVVNCFGVFWDLFIN